MHSESRRLGPLVVAALGIVFGDIGTSPLYAIKECFSPQFGLALTPDNILGILSVLFWTIIVIISVKYMIFILEADNRGEGGILALMALATMTGRSSRLNLWVLIPFGLFGAALLFGDGIITPAISVISAVEGLKIATPVFEPYIVLTTSVILISLFAIQKHGTARIGAFFGPIIAIWFLTLAVLGIRGILNNPSVVGAINPVHAYNFFVHSGSNAFPVLGAVFLVVTGGEALYADMGHFGKIPIRWAWFTLVAPSLTLNYFGQGAILLERPEAIENPFFLLAPESLLIPLVVLATLATVIASQALISGIFSITKQAVQLGYLPRVQIIHTSQAEVGQIYVPLMNWIMLAGVLWLVAMFRSSSALAAAYGIAVTATMAITTTLAFFVARRLWRWRPGPAFVFAGFFLTIDLLFFAACAIKFFDGGWFPVSVALAAFIIITTWRKGRTLLARHLKTQSMPIEIFLRLITERPPVRVQGTAIYMSGDPWGVPIALLHNLRHNKALHSRLILLTINMRNTSYNEASDRVRIEKITANFYRVNAYYGFMETPRIREILDACRNGGLEVAPGETTFVLGRETIVPSKKPGMAVWREHLFAAMSRNAQRPSAYFDIPVNQVIEVGVRVEI